MPPNCLPKSFPQGGGVFVRPQEKQNPVSELLHRIMGFLSNPFAEREDSNPRYSCTPHFECGPIDHSGTSPFRSREEDLPRSPDPKPLFWDCKYRHIFYFRTFSCGKNHIWLKKRLRRPCFCRFSGIIRTFDFVEDTPARQNAGKFAFAFAGSYLCKRTDPLRACSIFRARPFIKMNDTKKTGTVFRFGI